MLKLKELRKNKKISLKKLGEILGLAESTISLYENGKREPDICTLIKISDYFNVSVDELLGNDNKDNVLDEEQTLAIRDVHTPIIDNFCTMCSSLDEKTLDRIHNILYSLRRLQNNVTINSVDKQYLFACIAEFVGRTEMYVDNLRSFSLKTKDMNFADYNKKFINGEVEVIKEIVNTVSPPSEKSKFRGIVIPYFETPASAGNGSFLFDDIPEEWITVPKTHITTQTDFIIEIRGNSMEPDYFDGDKVCVQKSNRIYEGDIGVFILNNESYIKRMGKGELISLNSDYEPIKLNDYDDVHCVGKVTGKLKM